MEINSQLFSLADLVKESPDWHFSVPIYQRLYVWGEAQVLTLLHDLLNAYERQETLFFLGGTLLVERKNEAQGRYFDLIDGQQRFTTLWLICHAWRRALEPFLTATTEQGIETRLRFAVRSEVNRYLDTLVSDMDKPDENVEATKAMQDALGLTESIFEKRPLPQGITDKQAYLNGLTNFIYNQVKFVVTTVPKEIDLNKLFEVINNRGVQLQHHEILKAQMLDELEEHERGTYAVMWEVCADMDSYIEKNLSALSYLEAPEVSALYENGKLNDAFSVREKLEETSQTSASHFAIELSDILDPDVTSSDLKGENDETKEDNKEPSRVRSIFGFPLFLQHVLRIWLLKHEYVDLPRIRDSELLALFSKHFFCDEARKGERVRSFIDLLWEIRFVFDRYIIKWVDQGEEDIHLIATISVSEDKSSGKRYMSRSQQTDSHHAFSLLQSMLYHSQEITTQYWLTPLLDYINKNPDRTTKDYFNYLRHLDNHLFGSSAEAPLVERTRGFMQNPWQRHTLTHATELTEPNGVKFAHYWFYKLEFVLWFLNDQKKPDQGKRKRWDNFRFTAKNSVEHISPQNPIKRDENCVTEKMLDHFGNLALVSRSLNSEYSNLPFNEKRQRFINKNKDRVDSLKMDLIYESEQWSDMLASNHQDKMIKCITRYTSMLCK